MNGSVHCFRLRFVYAKRGCTGWYTTSYHIFIPIHLSPSISSSFIHYIMMMILICDLLSMYIFIRICSLISSLIRKFIISDCFQDMITMKHLFVFIIFLFISFHSCVVDSFHLIFPMISFCVHKVSTL